MKNKNTNDKSAPYRSLGLQPIKAPVKPSGEPKSTVKKGKGDLRGGKR